MTDGTADEAFRQGLRKRRIRRFCAFGLAATAMAAAMVVSLGVGAFSIGPLRVVGIIVDSFVPGGGDGFGFAADRSVLLNLRLPRSLLGVLAGAGLGLSGAALQGLTRNVLVSPFTLGIAPAAAFGASFVILFGGSIWPQAGSIVTVAAAFVVAFVCAVLVLAFSSLRGVSATVLILSGVALTQLFGALTAALQFIASEQQLASIVHWTFGSLNGARWNGVLTTAIVLALAGPVVVLNASALNAFAAGGDEVVASLGFPVARIRWTVTVATALITAAIVSFVGVIGFVGLVAPHIARMVIGGDHRVLLPYAALTGATLVLIADLLGRIILAPVLIPVGIVVAFIGVPIFLQLLISRRRDWAD